MMSPETLYLYTEFKTSIFKIWFLMNFSFSTNQIAESGHMTNWRQSSYNMQHSI